MNRSQEGAEEKSVEMWEKLGENGVEKRPQPLNQISNNVKQTLTQTHTVKQRFGELCASRRQWQRRKASSRQFKNPVH